MIRSFFNAVWDRWANLHPFVRFVGYVVLLGACGLLVVKPGYRRFKAWRLDKNLEAAQEAVKSVRMDEARDLSLTVLRAGDPRIEGFRVLEKSMASLRDPRHADIARALISHPEGSDEDRLNGFRGMVHDVPLGLLGQAWATLPENCQKNPDFANLFATRLLADGRAGEAASVLLQVPEEAKNEEIERNLIRVLILSAKREGYEEAQRRIVAKWPANGRGVGVWLDLLESIPALSLQADILRPILSQAPTATDEAARHSLLICRVDYALRFPSTAGVLEEAVVKWKDTAPDALAKFLDDLGLFRLMLEVFPDEAAKGHPELVPHMLAAMRQTGEWTRMGMLLDQEKEALQPILGNSIWAAHRAVAAGKSGDTPRMAQEWGNATNEAKSVQSSNPYLPLFKIALDGGMQREATEAMLAAVRFGRGPLSLYENQKFLLMSLAAQGREHELMEICAIYLPYEPGNPVLLTQYAYLACLNSLADPQTVLRAFKPLADAFPDMLPIQCVLATIHLCEGKPAEAAAVLDKLKVDPKQISPGYQAAFLTTQVLNGRLPKNDPSVEKFPWKALLPSERRRYSEMIKAVE